MNYTYSEMISQYEALRKTFDYITGRKDELRNFYKEYSPKTLTYTGCGSSYYLCQSAEFSARVRLGIPATAMASGDLMMNYQSYSQTLEGTLLITPTRSGSTSEVLLAVANVKSAHSTPVLAITCVADSELSKKADLTLELPWAFDKSVCQTRTVTNLYTANLLVLGYLCGDQKLIDDIHSAIESGNGFIENYEGKIKSIVEEDWRDAVVLADGEMQGIATEGALAFTEIARIPGRYYHLLDVRHGPMVLINNHTLVIMCLTAEGYEYQTALISDLVNKGATVITYSNLPLKTIPGVKLQISSGLSLNHAVRGIHFIFIAQAFSYFKAIHKGVDPDQPEGLDAWIRL
jgi:Predicted phosphosugar isomerases